MTTIDKISELSMYIHELEVKLLRREVDCGQRIDKFLDEALERAIAMRAALQAQLAEEPRNSPPRATAD